MSWVVGRGVAVPLPCTALIFVSVAPAAHCEGSTVKLKLWLLTSVLGVPSTSATLAAITVNVQLASNGRFTLGLSTSWVTPGAPTGRPARLTGDPLQLRVTASASAVTASLKLIVMFVSARALVPNAGRTSVICGAGSPTLSAVTLISSMPTHSSLPEALAVIIRTWSWDWLLAAAGNGALTLITCVARLGPVVASRTKPAPGTFVKLPVVPTR